MAPVATIPCPNSDITEVSAPDVIRTPERAMNQTPELICSAFHRSRCEPAIAKRHHA